MGCEVVHFRLKCGQREYRLFGSHCPQKMPKTLKCPKYAMTKNKGEQYGMPKR